MKKAVSLYAFFIAYFTLYPWLLVSAGEPITLLQGLRPLAGLRAYADAVGNILFYLPLGVLGALTWGGPRAHVWRRVMAVTAGGAVLSLMLEIAQAWVPERDSSVQDLLLNTLGTLAGARLGLAVTRNRGSDASWPIVAPRWSIPVVLVLAWIVAQWFPFLPVLRIPALKYTLVHAIRLPAALWLDLADTVIGCLLLSCLLRASLPRHAWSFALIAAGLVLPLRTVLMAGSVSWALMFGAGAALLVSRVVPGSRQGTSVIAGLAVLQIVVRKLYAANAWGAPLPSAVPPFSGFPGAARDAAVRVVAWKFFLYGSTLWMLLEALKRSRSTTRRR